MDDKLHKLLDVKRAQDICTAWCYKDQKRYLYSWSMVQKKSGRAWSMNDILEFTGHKWFTNVWHWVHVGLLAEPETTVPIGQDPEEVGFGMTGKGGRRYCFWQTKDIEDMVVNMEKKGWYKNLPTTREVRAFAKYDIMLYAKSPNGEGFVPVWEAETW